MGRIRTIKPDFPQSESMGRVTRDARLLFVQLFTIVDDSGRARGASRLLASLLYPFDADAPELIGTWLDELISEGCVILYEADGNKYLQIVNWLKHQKIDKPSASKIPPFDEHSTNIRRTFDEASITDMDKEEEEYMERKDIYVPKPETEDCANAPGPVNRSPVVPVSDIEIILEFINRKTGKAYKAKRPDGNLTANANYIKAILKSGYSVQDCKTVFARKFNEWGDSDKMAVHLTPETIYRKKNFDKYLAECTADNPLRKAE